MLKKLMAIFRRHKLPDHMTVQVYDGEPVDEMIRKDGDGRFVRYTHTCCGCGLRHTIRINISRNKLIFKYWRH